MKADLDSARSAAGVATAATQKAELESTELSKQLAGLKAEGTELSQRLVAVSDELKQAQAQEMSHALAAAAAVRL